jgi:hypothetical protein
MTYDEAYSEAIDGAWVRATDMNPGVYISYNFDGLRINHPGGSSSGWHARDIDRAAEWEICGPPEAPCPEPKPDKWGRPVPCAPFTGPEADAYHKTLPPIVEGWGSKTPEPAKDKWGRKHG